MKICACCGKGLQFSDFYKRKSSLDGCRSECKSCSSEKSKKYYLGNEVKVKSVVSAWTKTEKGRESRKASTYKWVENNRVKSRAHDAVARAIKSGKLKQYTCESCEDPKSQAHHEDYSKPLEVVWLCSKCHTQRHKEIDNEGVIKIG